MCWYFPLIFVKRIKIKTWYFQGERETNKVGYKAEVVESLWVGGSKVKAVWKMPKKQTRYQLMDQPTNSTIIMHNTKHLSRILRITGTGYNNNYLRISWCGRTHDVTDISTDDIRSIVKRNQRGMQVEANDQGKWVEQSWKLGKGLPKQILDGMSITRNARKQWWWKTVVMFALARKIITVRQNFMPHANTAINGD